MSKFKTTNPNPLTLQGTLVSTSAISVARLYQTGVNLITTGRPNLASVSIQNLHATSSVRFWHGLIPIDPLDPEGSGYLPQDPTSWTAGQITTATNTVSVYGEIVQAGQYLEPFLVPNGILYSYVASGTVPAHVKEG